MSANNRINKYKIVLTGICPDCNKESTFVNVDFNIVCSCGVYGSYGSLYAPDPSLSLDCKCTNCGNWTEIIVRD